MDATRPENPPATTNDYLPDAARIEKIRDAIARYNAERPAIRTRALLQIGLFCGGYLLVVGFIFLAFRHGASRPLGIELALGGVGAYFVWRFAWKPARDHQVALRHRLFPEVFGFIEEVRYAHGSEPAFIADLRRMDLVSFTSSENDDALSGLHEGMRFHLAETALVSGSGKHKKTVFAGIIFNFRLETPFAGKLLAASKGGWLVQAWRDLFGTRNAIVTAGDARIDADYEFRTDNAAAAQRLIEDAMTPALAYFRGAWKGGQVLIAIRNHECYLLMPSTKDHFMLPGIGRDIDFRQDLLPMISEMAVLLAFAHLVRKIA